MRCCKLELLSAYSQSPGDGRRGRRLASGVLLTLLPSTSRCLDESSPGIPVELVSAASSTKLSCLSFFLPEETTGAESVAEE